MRRTSSAATPKRPGGQAGPRRRFAASLVVAGLCAACGGPAAEVTVVLRPAEGVTLEPVGALKLIVRDGGEAAPEVFGPLALDRDEPLRLPALVPPARDFYVDVWACPSVAACAPADLVGRGCTDVVSVPEGSKDRVLAVVLYPPDDPRALACPPELP